MNREQRRRVLGGRAYADKRKAERAEGVALRLTPAQAREQLARWAARPGHSQAEVDRLNGRSDDAS